MSTQSAYPLQWPSAWPRCKFPISSRFSTRVRGEVSTYRKDRTMAQSTACVMQEVRALKAVALVISTNVELRLDGLPRSDRRAPMDKGVAVYFTLKGRRTVLACDKWNRVEDNLYAIAKDIEATRGRERWGVGSVEQAFAGYAALPPAGSSAGASWWNVLGCAHDAPFDVVKDAYRDKARAAHPDNGGSHDAMVLLNSAWDQARAAFNPQPATL
jgi:hypothetical protein